MKNIQNTAAAFFVTAISILTTISIMGVWEIFGKDVIWKSFQTLGLLAIVAIIVILAGRHLENRSVSTVAPMPEVPSPGWRALRTGVLSILIIAVSLLALLGVLAIWEVLQDKDVLYKSLGSLGILAFGAFLIVGVSLDREGKLHNKKISGGTIIAGLIFLVFSLYFVRVFTGFFLY